MSLRMIVIAAVVGIGILAFVAWRTNQTPTPASAPPPAAQVPGSAGNAPGGEVAPPPRRDAGVAWDKPDRWTLELGHEMRLATYVIASPVNGVKAAECAVYYFGPGQGGGVEANLERWASEFEGGAKPKRSKLTAAGMTVNRVQLRGTYRAHAGMSGGAEGPVRDVTLLGAIVEGPNGPLFFKLVGPTRTVGAAEKEFDALLKSLRKTST